MSVDILTIKSRLQLIGSHSKAGLFWALRLSFDEMINYILLVSRQGTVASLSTVAGLSR